MMADLVNLERIKYFVASMDSNDTKITYIYTRLSKAWGADKIVTERRIRQLVVEYKEEAWISLERKEGSGCPRLSKTTDNIQIISDIIEVAQHKSLAAISELTDIHKSSVICILKMDLNKKGICFKWVPLSISDDHKRQRVLRQRICCVT